MAGGHIRIRGELSVVQLGVRIIFLHYLHFCLIFAVKIVRFSQCMANVCVFYDAVILMLKKSCAFPCRWQPIFATCQPCVRCTVGILEHTIPESSIPAKLEQKFTHVTAYALELQMMIAQL